MCFLHSPGCACHACCLQLKEITNTLELVQGQRNDLRQEVKDLKAALAEAKEALDVSIYNTLTPCKCLSTCFVRAQEIIKSFGSSLQEHYHSGLQSHL